MKMQSEQRAFEAEWSPFTAHLPPLIQGMMEKSPEASARRAQGPCIYCARTAEASDSGQPGLFPFWKAWPQVHARQVPLSLPGIWSCWHVSFWRKSAAGKELCNAFCFPTVMSSRLGAAG